MGRKLGSRPLFGEGSGSPSNTKSPGPRPNSIPSGIELELELVAAGCASVNCLFGDDMRGSVGDHTLIYMQKVISRGISGLNGWH